MEVFHQLEQLAGALGKRRTSVAIGNFDGVHLGHQALLRNLLANAQDRGTVPAVLTFYPHPVEVLRPGQARERLTTAAEKLSLLEDHGVELVLVAPFDARLAALSPEQFFQTFLEKGLHARSVHVGFNFFFGKARAGDTNLLEKLCVASGISVAVEPAFELEGTRVSSSLIRQALRDGDVTAAARYLGRRYTINGQVQKGDERGRKLGFPTANLRCSAEKELPRNGVYVTRATWQKQRFLSVTNVGVRPTFTDASPGRSVEVHLLDFSTKIYDEFIELEFCSRIRDEKKFESVDALKAQIVADIKTARAAGC